MRLTKPQLKALKYAYQNSTLKEYLVHPGPFAKGTTIIAASHYTSFLSFRRAVVPEFAGNGAVMVQWCGMWLGIETDGYTHS